MDIDTDDLFRTFESVDYINDLANSQSAKNWGKSNKAQKKVTKCSFSIEVERDFYILLPD